MKGNVPFFGSLAELNGIQKISCYGNKGLGFPQLFLKAVVVLIAFHTWNDKHSTLGLNKIPLLPENLPPTKNFIFIKDLTDRKTFNADPSWKSSRLMFAFGGFSCLGHIIFKLSKTLQKLYIKMYMFRTIWVSPRAS